MAELVRAEPAAQPAGATGEQASGGYAAIEVEGLEKAFQIPHHQVQTFKERALHPFRRTEHDELRVLRGIDFDVRAGEFFGIVGRNGSGKSTLLKCLAGIYASDRGTIRVAGRVSPFIELGVGFNPDLAARDNVVINAVMMGLTPREARARFDDIIGFAELEPFVEMKLKNYSSGMQVRLAFAVMVQSGSEILLIDEVLAVGDAAFQQRCLDEFYRLKREGRTIVLVTHDMATVERFCHRAMLLTGGEIDLIGDPHAVGRRYIERNFENYRGREPEDAAEPAQRAEISAVWLEDPDGRRVDSIQHATRLHLHALIEAQAHVPEPIVDFWVDDERGTRLFATSTRPWDESPPLAPGERLHVRVTLDNRLANGRYHVGCSLLSGRAALDIAALDNRAADFVVFNADRVYGSVLLDHELEVDGLRPGAAR